MVNVVLLVEAQQEPSMSPQPNAKKYVYLAVIVVCLIAGGGLLLLLDHQVPSASPAIAATQTPTNTNLQELLAKASIPRGHMMAHTCNDCHTFDEDGPHRFGPNLFGIFGAHHASKKDFAYSDALKAQHNKVWNEENLYAWLMNPKAYAPGTKMGYPGVSSAQDRADIIAYLKTLKAE